MHKRLINIKELVERKSIFLFGARQTGKSTLVTQTFPKAKVYNLLLADVFHKLSVNPALIRQELQPQDEIILIDEIQKIPQLLDEVHYLIEANKNLRFILTGSSARSLRRRGVNLLAGRTWTVNLFPLVSPEINFKDLNQLMTRGGLPAIFDSDFYERDLESYVGTYLKEEIVSEAIIRNVGLFSRFLGFASLYNCEQVNFTNIASDLGVAPNTVREYFQILEDTLIGHMLEPFQGSKRKVMSKSKFYLFDLGVSSFLSNQQNQFLQGSDLGKRMEQLIFLELKAYLNYTNQAKTPIHYWRTTSKLEVDFIVNGRVAIEVKASQNIKTSDCKGLTAFEDEVSKVEKIIVCNEVTERVIANNIKIYPIENFLRKLWAGEIF